MRLNSDEINTILDITHSMVGGEAQVSLFGSRLEDTKQGGDVDLLIESTTPLSLMQRARMKMALEDQLQLPVDLVVAALNTPGSPFIAIAKANAQRLERPLKH